MADVGNTAKSRKKQTDTARVGPASRRRRKTQTTFVCISQSFYSMIYLIEIVKTLLEGIKPKSGQNAPSHPEVLCNSYGAFRLNFVFKYSFNKAV